MNTIKNYSCDLGDLGVFCDRLSLDFQKLGLPELEQYHQDLIARGLRPNSRRRKLMTAKSFLRYLSGRMDVSTVGSEKIIPPEKVEAPPRLVSKQIVFDIVTAQPDTDIGWRNRALIGVLLDTGMLVTEALNLRQDECFWENQGGASLRVSGKRERSCRVSPATAEALKQVQNRVKSRAPQALYFFYGYSRSGPNPEKLTSRGVEVLFKAWAKQLEADRNDPTLRGLHPRTLRHLFVVDMLLSGKSEAEVMVALGLRTPYSFRVYRPLVEEIKGKLISKTSATYNPEISPAVEAPQS